MKKIESNLNDLSIIDKLKAFFRMISKTISGNYKPNKLNLIISFISVIYVISPIDIIPEIPFGLFGLVDDAAIITFAYTRLNKEIKNFIDWENQQNSNNNSVITID